ncbi:MAG: glycosyltransferase family 4 protein [Crocinitomicaceae bacterium]|nr:glycosyltransferase family 4 protein [Crocinitomicaceae bacterium]
MKVLQLCHKPPIPTIDGGCIAINNISQGLLQKGIELKIFTASTEKHPFLPDEIPTDFKKKTKIEGLFLDTRVNIIDAFSALVTSDSYNISRFFSPDFNKRLIDILEQDRYDVVHLESLFMTPYVSTIRAHSKAKVILRSHNLEHLIWERLANSTGNKAKKVYLKHLAAKLKKYELNTINEVDGIAAISQEDTDRFKSLDCSTSLITVPFGIDLEKYNVLPNKNVKKNRLFHIGAMNWEPNKEAINWFIDSVFPKISKLDIEIHLAGRAMPKSMFDIANDQLKVHGEVENAQDFMNANDIMIVPLLSGSGMRIKIIEAMALGKAVISTSVGAEGIAYTNNENIIIADSAKDFAKAIEELINNPDKVTLLGNNARKLIESSYSNDSIINNLISFYQSK